MTAIVPFQMISAFISKFLVLALILSPLTTIIAWIYGRMHRSWHIFGQSAFPPSPSIPDSWGWWWCLVRHYFFVDSEYWRGPVHGFQGGWMRRGWRRWGRCLRLRQRWRDVGPVGAPLSHHCPTSVAPLSHLYCTFVPPLSRHLKRIRKVHNGILQQGLNIYYLYQQWSFIFYFRKK